MLLGRLGVEVLQRQGRDWNTFPRADPATAHYFGETGHAIGHAPFWQYFSSHGLEFDARGGKSLAELIALFGYPVSEPAHETNSSGDNVLTQWFERARFEDHGDKGVLLGLLGNEVTGERRGEGPFLPVAAPPGPPSGGAPARFPNSDSPYFNILMKHAPQRDYRRLSIAAISSQLLMKLPRPTQ